MNPFESVAPQPAVLTITPQIKDYLTETSKWGKFLFIMGYICVGLLVCMGAMISVFSPGLYGFANNAFPIGIIGPIYIAFGVVYFFPVRYLHKFCSDIRHATLHDDATSFDSAFSNLKSLFKFMGIMTIVMMALYALIIVAALGMAIMARH